jgi:alkylhydroperoxidase family enzyme
MRDWASAPLAMVDRALCAYAAKLTHTPTEISNADLDGLRDAGLDDRALHDATQIIGLFNYFPRIADGLGIDLEPLELVRAWGELGLNSRLKPDPARGRSGPIQDG